MIAARCCATAKSWAWCASNSLGGAEQAFTWWHHLQRQGRDRVTPRLAENAARVLAKPRSSSMPTDLAAFYLANGYRQGEWGTPDRYRRPPFAWESDCRD
jgi:hypothetical protein